MRLSRKDARKLQRLLAQPRPCLLCGAYPPHYTGTFQPDRPEAWGGKPGKSRLLGYALCRACFALPDRCLHVEARLMRALVGQQN